MSDRIRGTRNDCLVSKRFSAADAIPVSVQARGEPSVWPKVNAAGASLGCFRTGHQCPKYQVDKDARERGRDRYQHEGDAEARHVPAEILGNAGTHAGNHLVVGTGETLAIAHGATIRQPAGPGQSQPERRGGRPGLGRPRGTRDSGSKPVSAVTAVNRSSISEMLFSGHARGNSNRESRLRLALFDFDGTITNKDSWTAFLRFSATRQRLVAATILLSPLIIGYKLGWISGRRGRPIAARFSFYGSDAAVVRAKGRTFAREILPAMMRRRALERIAWHRQQGDTVVVVSASLDVYLVEWWNPPASI